MLIAHTEKLSQRLPSIEHVAKCGVNKPHANNNRIERLNGTLRERVKVQRGWKSYRTQITEGKRIQYNFVKPHMALKGQTPAEASGIMIKDVDSSNTWLSLFRKAHGRNNLIEKTNPRC